MDIKYLSYKGVLKGVKVDIEKTFEKDGIIVYRFALKSEKAIQPSPITVKFSAPVTGFFSQWSPTRGVDRTLPPNWSKPTTASRLASGAPLHCFIGQDGINKVCLAVSDVKTPIAIRSGLHETFGTVDYQVEFFSSMVSPIFEYSAYIRFDVRELFYSDVIAQAVNWWDDINELPETSVPEDALMPVYSTWYNFNQNINDEEIIAECEKAYKLGMRTVIVDDGWQTDDVARGYAYCGEWKLCKSKIKDMRGFSQRLHQIGMKIMLWYSVPFVGKKTEIWKKFKGKYLDNPENEWNCLDPRFPEVREYLVNTYETALKEWDIDGFKLDFIDSMVLTEFSDKDSKDRDFESLEDSLEALLAEISDRLKKIRPDILIEFRQGYIGPVVKAYGNMLRVGDCAYDMIKNRMGVIDLRLTSGKTAVHSDMIIWNYDDSVENAAKQLIAVLFGVPQISVMLNKLSEEHLRMLTFYLNFWMKNRDIFLDGELKPYNPECFYSLVETAGSDTSINVCYNKNVVDIHNDNTIIVNGTGEKYIVLHSEQERNVVYTRTNCIGEIVETKIISDLNGDWRIGVNPADILDIRVQN